MSAPETPGSRPPQPWFGLFVCVLGAAALLAAAPILLPAATAPPAPLQDTGRGSALALDGGWLALGSRFEPSTGQVGVRLVSTPQPPRTGAVLLFQKSAGLWTERGALFAGDARPGDQFGAAVALRDGVLAVGAPGWKRGGRRRGAVYVYRQAAGGWSPSEVVTGCAGSPAIDRFGRSLALDGGWLAIGGAGAVCLRFVGAEPDPSAARREQRLASATAAAGATDSRFGESVALSGPLLAVGAPGRDVGDGGDAGACRSCGAVDLFQLGRAGWAPAGSLTAPDGASFDQFGSAVAVSGDRIAVGAAGVVVNGQRSGAVYVFFPSLSGAPPWFAAPRVEPPAPGPYPGERFGAALALDGGLLAVGAPALPFADSAGNPASFHPGAAYVFEALSDLVTHPVPLDGLSTSQLDLFGAAVAVRGREVIVGAPLAAGAGTDAGAARAYVCATGCSVLADQLPPTKTQGSGRP